VECSCIEEVTGGLSLSTTTNPVAPKTQDRAGAIQYFAERPGLTKALFQGQILLGAWLAVEHLAASVTAAVVMAKAASCDYQGSLMHRAWFHRPRCKPPCSWCSGAPLVGSRPCDWQ
jgi:hypothetical protein